LSRFLLDTSTVSAAMWRVPSPGVLAKLRDHGAECAIGAPVWHELRFGANRLPRGRHRSALETYLDDVVRATLPILPYDERCAEWHAHERARLQRLGKTAPLVDGQIAAIAAVSGLALVTSNTADFKIFKGLTILDWTRPPRT
jgi:tRNA(fMet)-specific endonuclease VapC